MKMKRFISNILEENIYLLYNEKNECLVIDPGGTDVSDLIAYIKEKKLDLKYILITHGHFDHTKSIDEIIKFKKVPVCIGKEDVDIMFSSSNSMSLAFIGEEVHFDKNIEIKELNNGDEILGIKCLSTPGHTKGSMCYYLEKEAMLFTGDTLFKNAYGRTDFPSGDSRQLRDSLNIIFKMPEEITVYSGHGNSTNMKTE